ncbi:phosphotransferase [Shewanella sp. Scap07]|uniref:phosphotransferase n=1 Tax=Shewanella sp. Scap07 TaxID=2589987 RepID=UPI0015B8169C|nr:phosphotransferase [Shewanella sp. Scap07]QLE85609.1 phosphotransferase [Shewanella sp. Scap07]
MSILKSLQQHFATASVNHTAQIQSLWSHYGSIDRYNVNGSPVVVKSIEIPQAQQHPRGWHTNVGHQRKIRSYQIEKNWYRNHQTDHGVSYLMPRLIAIIDGDHQDQFSLVLSDLDASGFCIRPKRANLSQIKLMIQWLAQLHGQHLTKKADNNAIKDYWLHGSYWHLSTRPDELDAMANGKLRAYANEISLQLDNCLYQTIIHGDAKLANFCIHNSETKVAAVDFQYVGNGVGVKDLVYLLGSCLNAQQLSQHHPTLVDYYFAQLQQYSEHLTNHFDDLQQQWRRLIPYAYADFERFLAGWAPEHIKRNEFTDNMTRKAITDIELG